MTLTKTNVNDVLDLLETLEFPMTVEYLDPTGPYGNTYYGDEYDWYALEDVGLVCLAESEEDVHVSVLEVALGKRGRGYGTAILGLVNAMAGTRPVSLVAREPSLVGYYLKLDFVPYGDPAFATMKRTSA